MAAIRLDISHQNLGSLVRDYPVGIRDLRCSRNNFTSLHGIPDTVENLGCSYTHISSFVGCSKSAKRIVAVHCLIESLAGLPNTLDTLYVSYNKLRTLEGCPAARELDVSCNQLTDISGLPDGIEELSIANNGELRNCPPTLPGTLKIFRCSGCPDLNPAIFTVLPPCIQLVEIAKNPKHIESAEIAALKKCGVKIVY